LNLIPEEQWQQVLRLKESGQLKAAEDSLRQMIIRNSRNNQGAGFPDLYLSFQQEFPNRRPYWEVRKFSPDSLEYIRSTLSATVGYLQQLQPLSPTTIRKLEKSISSGVIYAPWELFYLADALGKSETLLKSTGCLIDLKVLTSQGIFNASDLPLIIEDIRKGNISQVGEILDKYGHNVLRIECPQKITDEQVYLRELLGKILSQLPFHQNHSIESIQFVKMEEWPGRGFSPYTLIHFVFNGKPYFISYPTSTLGYHLSKRIQIGFLPALLRTLSRDFGQSLQVHVVPSYYLNFITAVNANITNYHIILSQGGIQPSIDNIFYDYEIGSKDTLVSPHKKEEYLNNVLSVFDRRWEKTTMDSIHFRVKWFSIPLNSRILLQLPKTTHIVWVDDLNDEVPSPFKPVFDSLNNISGGRLNGYSIRGNCAKIEEGESYQLELTFNRHRYATILKKDSDMDYGFIKIIRQLQNAEDLGGRFYYLPVEYIDEGYTFIFLTTAEFNRLQQHPYFSVIPLEKLEKML
jgi:hypothetical protein